MEIADTQGVGGGKVRVTRGARITELPGSQHVIIVLSCLSEEKLLDV